MTPDRKPEGVSRSDRYATAAQIAIAASATAGLLLTGASRLVTDTAALLNVTIGALVVLYLVGAVWVTRRLLRTRFHDFRIALTGQPAVGKTVFANLLYDHLMNGNDPSYEFTAESKSAIATYQAIRGMTEDVWPEATTTGSVVQRDGALRHGRVVVDLEIGDSAGQHWLQLSEAASQETEADYLQWVLSAHALVHVIPADRMVSEGFATLLRSDIKDLRLASQLMRSVSRGSYRTVPILIVISKMDLVGFPLIEEDMMRIFSPSTAELLESTRRLGEVGRSDMTALFASLSEELLADFRFVNFTYSSAEIVKDLSVLGSRRHVDVPAWIVATAAGNRNPFLQRLFD